MQHTESPEIEQPTPTMHMPKDEPKLPEGESEVETRDWKAAVLRGLRLRCPSCGEGKMLHSYLKVRHSCDHCGQELFHNRADDGPAYLTILIVGHILGFALHITFVLYRPDPLVLAMIMSAVTIGTSLWLLPRMKGLVVAYQWAKRMHGF